jgi:hypothetical protein
MGAVSKHCRVCIDRRPVENSWGFDAGMRTLTKINPVAAHSSKLVRKIAPAAAAKQRT